MARVGCALDGDGDLADAAHPIESFPEDTRYLASERDSACRAFANLRVPTLQGFFVHGHPTLVPSLLERLSATAIGAVADVLAGVTQRGAEAIASGRGSETNFIDGHLAMLKTVEAGGHGSAAAPWLRALTSLEAPGHQQYLVEYATKLS